MKVKLDDMLNANEAPNTEPTEQKEDWTKRLTTGNVLLTLSQLGTQLETAVKAYQQLPEATPQQVDDILKAIGTACGNAMAKAQKLLEGNR